MTSQAFSIMRILSQVFKLFLAFAVRRKSDKSRIDQLYQRKKEVIDQLRQIGWYVAEQFNNLMKKISFA